MCTLKCVYFERIQSSSKWAILRTNEWNRKEFFYLSTDAIKRTFAGCFALSDIRLTDQPKAHGLITLTLINTTRRADWRTCHPTRHFRCLLQVYHTDDEQTMQHTFIAIVLMTHTTLSTLVFRDYENSKPVASRQRKFSRKMLNCSHPDQSIDPYRYMHPVPNANNAKLLIDVIYACTIPTEIQFNGYSPISHIIIPEMWQ